MRCVYFCHAGDHTHGPWPHTKQSSQGPVSHPSASLLALRQREQQGRDKEASIGGQLKGGG